MDALVWILVFLLAGILMVIILCQLVFHKKKPKSRLYLVGDIQQKLRYQAEAKESGRPYIPLPTKQDSSN